MDIVIILGIGIVAVAILIITGIVINITNRKNVNVPVNQAPQPKTAPIPIEPKKYILTPINLENKENIVLKTDQPIIPPGMKECFQCKSIIRQDVITCPHCGKSPEKSVAVWGAVGQLGNLMFLLGICLLLPLVLAMCGYLGLF